MSTAQPESVKADAGTCVHCRTRIYRGSNYKAWRWYHGWSGLEACQCEPLGCPGAGSHNHIGLEESSK